MKRVFIIHGWEGYPEEAWFVWLKKELEKKGFKAYVPQMPNADVPVIKEWVSFIEKLVGKCDKDTYLVGHSIGCQAIMRYLEKLPKNAKAGGAVFVGGWFNLKPETYEGEGEEETEEISRPWRKTPIDFEKIKSHTRKFVAIFSDNDYFVPLGDSKTFKEKLGAKIVIEHKKGHMGGNDDDVFELPSALKSVLEISK